MADFDAIVTAIATRYNAAHMTAPSPYGAVRFSTAELPNQLTALPCVLVFPDRGTFEHYPSGRMGVHRFILRFYFSMGLDISRDMTALRKWLIVLTNQLQGAVQLGGIVAVAHVIEWVIQKMTYAGDDFNGIELIIEVTADDTWAPVA